MTEEGAKHGGSLPKLGWFAAALLPPGAIAAFWSGFARRHAGWAALIVAVAWVVMVAVRFAVGFVQDLVTRRREGWVDTADKALRRRFTKFGERYHEHLAAGLRFVDQKGLATTGFYAPELDEVFVDVSLMLRAPGQVRGDLLAELPEEATERNSITHYLDAERPVVLVILGPPGSGKTTLLRHTARRICRAPKKARRPIPILLYLRDHAVTIAATPSTALPELVRATLGPLAAEEPPGWFEQHLRAGRCVVLLDGLDEVADDQARRAVADWVERQVTQYSHNDFVISSRPKGYEAAPIEGATVVQTRHFTDDQIVRFIDGWYFAVEREAARGESDEEVRRRAAEGAEDLRSKLRAAPALFDLTINPLLLTMIANVHRHRQALPGSRAGLYGEICEAMLWRRPIAKKLTVEPSGEQKETVLRHLAYEMMRAKVRDLPQEKALEVLRKPVRRISRDLTPAVFLADVGTSGLLHERENGVYSFAHLTFQEYLAAAHIKDKGLTGTLAEVVDDDWWRECTLLYAAKSDVGPLVEACLESGTATALALAFDCAEEGKELAPELRDALDELLVTATDPAQRRLMAGVAVSRRLRQVVRTTAGTRVCATPITNDLYDLFLRDSPQPRPPDRGDAGAPDDPVTGIRPGDALAFVEWVNGLVGDKAVYRLVTEGELADSAVRRLLTARSIELAFYTHPNAVLDEIAELRAGHTVSGAVVRERVQSELHAWRELFAGLLYIRAASAATALLRLLELAQEFQLDVAMARVTDVSNALTDAFAAGLMDLLDPGLGLEVIRAAEAQRVSAVVATFGDELTGGLVRDVARLLARDLVRDLTVAREVALVHVHQEQMARLETVTDALRHDVARDWQRAGDLRAMMAAAQRPEPDRDRRALAAELSRASGITDLGGRQSVQWYRTTQMAERAELRDRVLLPDYSRGLRQALGAVLTWQTAGEHQDSWQLGDSAQLNRDFAARLAERIPETATYNIDIEHISVVLAEVIEGAPRLLEPAAWSAKLAALARPILDRSRRMLLMDATKLRILALLLSYDTEGLVSEKKEDFARNLHLLAAFVTWLEDRHTGAEPAVEGILLAID